MFAAGRDKTVGDATRGAAVRRAVVAVVVARAVERTRLLAGRSTESCEVCSRALCARSHGPRDRRSLAVFGSGATEGSEAERCEVDRRETSKRTGSVATRERSESSGG